MFTQTFTGINSPGYNLPIFSISAASNPAITAPPTGTRKFLSVDWTNTSTRPTLWACEWIHSTQLKKQNQTSVCLQTFYYKFWSHVCFFNGWCNVRAQTSTLDVQDAQSNHTLGTLLPQSPCHLSKWNGITKASENHTLHQLHSEYCQQQL